MCMEVHTIRRAIQNDLDGLFQADPIALATPQRRVFIRQAVQTKILWVAMLRVQAVGYLVFEHSFFERGFVSMVMVHPAHRRSGIGSALLRHAENLCQSDRIFSSTNESNLPMQRLLLKFGYHRSGMVDDLDPGDPEVFFSKQVGTPPKGDV